jgi:hypothetical protein
MKLADISIRQGQPSQAINIIDALFTKVKIIYQCVIAFPWQSEND